MEHLTRGASAPPSAPSSRRSARLGTLAFAAALAVVGGGFAPAALAATPDAITSPVVITPDQRHGSLLITTGSNASFEFVDGGLEMSVDAAGHSLVELRYTIAREPLASLLSDPTLGIRMSDTASKINMRLLVENPDNPAGALNVIRFDAANNGGVISADASTATWYSEDSFAAMPNPGGQHAFQGTLTELLAAYGDNIVVRQMGFDLGRNLVQTPFVLYELKVGNQTILFDLDTRDLKVEYVWNGTVIDSQDFRKKDKTVLTEGELAVPAGYTLKAPFADHTVSANQTFSLEIVKPAPSFDTQVTYEDPAGKVVGSGETITKVQGSTITKADLTAVPAGYELVDPSFSYTVTSAGALVVKVQQAAVASFDVTVHYTVDGKKIEGASQEMLGLVSGSELTEADLKVPAGYKLVAPFNTQVVTSDLELSVPVQVVAGNGGNTPGDTGAGKPGLSNTGGASIAPALALAGLLGAAGIALTLRRRKA